MWNYAVHTLFLNSDFDYCYPNRSENSGFKRKINKRNKQKCEQSIAVAAPLHLFYASLQ